jgi:uncharacterized protein
VALTPDLDPAERLAQALAEVPQRIVACSGGVDSMLLATLAHRGEPGSTLIAHAVNPAVPGGATARVLAAAEREGWNLELVQTGEFDDEQYLVNPVDRCFHCKRNLYDALGDVAARFGDRVGWQVLSGANVDDLGEYRPGLDAAAQAGVRHPMVEAELTKADVRAASRSLGLDTAEMASSPCLASRLYTGTRVTESRLRAVDVGEELLRATLGIEVVRCRLREDQVLVEVPEADRPSITPELLARVADAMRLADPAIADATLDARPYRPGRAFLTVT